MLLDMYLSKEKKPTLLGAVNGMIVGLVVITPGAGYVNGFGAMVEAAIGSTIVWFAWTYIQPITLRHVDDAMGVVFTHGLAGLCGGLLVGIFADPRWSSTRRPSPGRRSPRPAGCTATGTCSSCSCSRP